MSDTVILNGKEIAKTIRSEIAEDVAGFVEKCNVVPQLAAVLVGEDPASQVYVRNKERACEKVGIKSQLHRLPVTTTEKELITLIEKLNSDKDVHGILVQLPLPDQIDEQTILDSVSAEKDVDAFHPTNVGLIVQGRHRYLPCTPHGMQQILARHEIETQGKHVVVLGRSNIVGKPIAQMLCLPNSPWGPKFANATVTICHSRTTNLHEVTRQADILVAAIGKPNFVTADMVKDDVVILDVGINRTDDGLVGDVDFNSVSAKSSAITPVPGGIGPMTIAMLLFNTLHAAKFQSEN